MYKFHLNTVALEHTKNVNYLSTTGNFPKAVNNLRKGQSIKMNIKLLESVTEPIALYVVRSGVHSTRILKIKALQKHPQCTAFRAEIQSVN